MVPFARRFAASSNSNHRRLVLVAMASVLLLSGCMLSPLFQAPAALMTGIAVLLGLAACGGSGGGGGGGGTTETPPAAKCITSFKPAAGAQPITFPATVYAYQLLETPGLGFILHGDSFEIVSEGTYYYGDGAGASVALGDANGDGVCDILIGTPNRSLFNEGSREGGAFIVFGAKTIGTELSGSSITQLADLPAARGHRFSGYSYGGVAGQSVAVVDTNGDGKAELLIGAPHSYGDNGVVWVINGDSIANLAQTNNLKVDPGAGYLSPDGSKGFVMWNANKYGAADADPDPNNSYYAHGYLGTALAVGDINGDGIADLVMGSPNTDSYLRCTTFYSGFCTSTVTTDIPAQAHFLLGAAPGVPQSNGFFDIAGLPSRAGSIQSFYTGDRTGASLAVVGDVDGDGLPDFLIGSPNWFTNLGAALIVFGRETAGEFPTDGSTLFGDYGVGAVLFGTNTGGHVGAVVAAGGDINGDGRPDMLISEYGVSGAPGRVHVVFGRATTAEWATGESFTFYGNLPAQSDVIIDLQYADQPAALLGADINGDGYSDVVILTRPSTISYTAAYVVFGGSALYGTINVGTLDGTNGFSVEGLNYGNVYTTGSLALGDVNGDGIPDLVIGRAGDYYDYNGSTGFLWDTLGGKVFVIFGQPAGATFPPPSGG